MVFILFLILAGKFLIKCKICVLCKNSMIFLLFIFLLMILFIIIASDCYMDIQCAKKHYRDNRLVNQIFRGKDCIIINFFCNESLFVTGCIIWIKEMVLSKVDISIIRNSQIFSRLFVGFSSSCL